MSREPPNNVLFSLLVTGVSMCMLRDILDLVFNVLNVQSFTIVVQLVAPEYCIWHGCCRWRALAGCELRVDAS